MRLCYGRVAKSNTFLQQAADPIGFVLRHDTSMQNGAMIYGYARGYETSALTDQSPLFTVLPLVFHNLPFVIRLRGTVCSLRASCFVGLTRSRHTLLFPYFSEEAAR